MLTAVSGAVLDAPDQGERDRSADKGHLSDWSFRRNNEGHYTDKFPRHFDGTTEYGVGVSGRVLELRAQFGWARLQNGGGVRGEVVDFSRASSRRLMRTTSMVEWDLLGRKVLVTLTYPEGLAPVDGREAKRHLKNFRARWRRRWGVPVTEVWKMEFHANGSPHFHLMIPWDGQHADMKGWLSNAWYEVCGKLSDAHLLAGTNVKFVHSDCSGYLADINAKKGHQNRKPVFFVNPGRYWNVCGERPKISGCHLSEDEFYRLRRAVVSWRRSQYRRDANGVAVVEPRILPIRKPNGRKARRKVPAIGGRAGGRLSGRWYLCPASSREVLAQLVRVLDRPVVPLMR